MKRKKAENYEAGYSKESLLKKCAAGALGAALLGGCLTACSEPQYAGNMSVEEYDGNMVISPSDQPSDRQDEPFLLDGDVTSEVSDGGNG